MAAISYSTDTLNIRLAQGGLITDTGTDTGSINLTPFFSHGRPESGTSDDYWKQLTSQYQPLEDGWCHFECDNSQGSSNVRTYYRIKSQDFVEPSTEYTFLIEFRNVQSISEQNFYASIASTSAGYIAPWSSSVFTKLEDGSYYKSVTTKDDFADVDCLTYGRYQVKAGETASFDVRVSLYKGNYSGEYIPPRSILATSVSFTKTDQLDVVLEVDDA